MVTFICNDRLSGAVLPERRLSGSRRALVRGRRRGTHLGVGKDSIYRWVESRDLPARTRHGKIVLVQPRDATDPKTGQRYTVNRYKSEKTTEGDSWRHEKIILEPANPDFQPIVLTGADEDELHVIAELVDVLGS